ncbi:hypothetical protein Godav_019544 [Gossypium davidsonii]|uniref:DUF4283 domain-containing protein n=2 Tax=Gossypium TaxID=3633 RepID=A0A7J8R052_GOSDV|nr:hypothetical protein [Gossypium davidsonii]MBA0653914.1 hypothetical protein [Gossypium klotzschianum]
MLPFIKGKEIEIYEFSLTHFWLQIYNIPLENLDRQNALDVGKAIGELVAIDWKDRNGGWTEFMRLKIKINVSCPLRRVVRLVGRDGPEIILAPHQNRAIWRNGIEMVATPTCLNDANDESKLDPREENCNTPNPYLSPD